jgi:hypothetical protein
MLLRVIKLAYTLFAATFGRLEGRWEGRLEGCSGSNLCANPCDSSLMAQSEDLTWPPQVRLFGARAVGGLRVLIIQSLPTP